MTLSKYFNFWNEYFQFYNYSGCQTSDNRQWVQNIMIQGWLSGDLQPKIYGLVKLIG